MSEKRPDTIPPELIGEDEALNSAVNYLNRGLKQNEDILYVAPDWAQRTGATDEPPWEPPAEGATPAVAAPRRVEPEDRPAALKYGMVTIPPKYQQEVAQRLAARRATEPAENVTARMQLDQTPPAADVTEGLDAAPPSRKWALAAVLGVLLAVGAVSARLVGQGSGPAASDAPSAVTAPSSPPVAESAQATSVSPALPSGNKPVAGSEPSASAEVAATSPSSAKPVTKPTARPEAPPPKPPTLKTAAPKPTTTVAPGGFDPAW